MKSNVAYLDPTADGLTDDEQILLLFTNTADEYFEWIRLCRYERDSPLYDRWHAMLTLRRRKYERSHPGTTYEAI